MKTLIVTFALVLGAAGCLGGYAPGDPTGSTADMAHAGSTGTGTGGNGSGTGNGNGSGTGTGNGSGTGTGSGSSSDMAMQTGTSGGDMAGAPVGTKLFGDTCTVDGDCKSGMCRQFVMGTVHRCTQPCATATQATDCPSPPSAGTCTNAVPAYCKFTQ